MLTFAGLYGLLALGLNLVWGMAGMINLGLVGFFAFGAYVSALATLELGVPIAAGLLAAMVLTAAAGAVMALTAARLRAITWPSSLSGSRRSFAWWRATSCG
jgi:branched-chain amino acid transport system permease protein